MVLEKKLLKILYPAMIALGLSLIVGMSLIISGWYFYENKQTAYMVQQSKLDQAMARLQTAKDNEDIISDFMGRFKKYEAMGLVGEENRLRWIQSLLKVSKELKFPHVEYQIQSRQPMTIGNILELSDYSVYASDMFIKLETLHEGDFFSLLNSMTRGGNGLFNVSECSLHRTSESLTQDPSEGNVETECKLSWLSVDKKIPTQLQGEDVL